MNTVTVSDVLTSPPRGLSLLMASELNRLLEDALLPDYIEEANVEDDDVDFTTSYSEIRYMGLKDKLVDIGGAYDDLKSLLRYYWKSLETLEPYQLSIIENLHERYLAQTSALGSIKLAEEGDVLSDISLRNEVKVSKGGKVYEYHCICVGLAPDDEPRVFVKVNSHAKASVPTNLVVKLELDEALYAGRVLSFVI